MDRRAFAFLVPYWRRLVLVLAISLVSTATTLAIPYLSKDLIDTRAHRPRSRRAPPHRLLVHRASACSASCSTSTSGLRYTRVSAEILFDMRLALYAHLQRLSPRFYARTRLGDIVARLNNDISEIQRVAAEAALAWVGNVLFLIGSLVMMVWLDWRLALIALAPLPISLLALVLLSPPARSPRRRAAAAERRHRQLPDRDAAGDDAGRRVERAAAREQDRFRGLNDAFIDALMGMQRVTYFAGGLPGTRAVDRIGDRVLLRRLARHRRHADAGHVGRVPRVSDARVCAGAGADGAVREPGHGARVVASRARDPRRADRRDRSAGCAGRSPTRAASWRSTR